MLGFQTFRCFLISRSLVPVLHRLAEAALLVAIAMSLISCSKGTESKPTTKYVLYAAMHGYAEGWIAVIDCSTDSIIDSVSRGFQSDPEVVVSPDGSYFAVMCSGRPAEIFDGVSRTQIRYLSAPSLPPVFVPSEKIIICPQFDSALVYGIPEFTLKAVWERPRWFAERLGTSGLVASADRQHGQMSHSSYRYVVYSSSGTPVDSFVISPDSGTQLIVDLPFTFSPDGTRFYGKVYGNAHPLSLAGYDLTNHALLFLTRTGDTPYDCQVSPDGREVWTVDHGDLYGFNPDHKGSIHVYDAVTGVLEDTVSVVWPLAGPARMQSPYAIRFLPNSDKVYINSFAGPIAIVNARTKAVEKVILTESGRFTMNIGLAPKP
ncbi:MAG: hypothetical protein HZB43_00435 [candidate division Zixibacteria bacterium]|nr:hypothetical protein [candidate division Zixibacteria bacterium]